jgi:hypothetical protein
MHWISKMFSVTSQIACQFAMHDATLIFKQLFEG